MSRQNRVDEVIRLEPHLLLRGWATRIEDRLARETSAGLDGERLDSVEAIFEKSPIADVRTLAAIALVRLGGSRLTKRAAERVVEALHGDGPLALEAALALGSWFLRAATDLIWIRELDLARAAKLAEPALEDPALRAHAAITCALPFEDGMRSPWRKADHERAKIELARLEPALKEAIEHADPDVHFAAALITGNEELLAQAKGADDARGRLARRALAGRTMKLMHKRFIAGTDDQRRELMREWKHPLDIRTIEVLLAGAGLAGEELRKDLVDYVVHRLRVDQHEPEARTEIARFYIRESAKLGLETVLRGFYWATPNVETRAEERAPLDTMARAFAVAASPRILELAKGDARMALMREHSTELQRFVYWGPRDDVRSLAESWSRDPIAALKFLEEVLELHGRLNSWGREPEMRAREVILEVFDLASGSELRDLARVLGAAMGRHRGIGGMEAIVRAFWDRFVQNDDPSRRAAIMTVLASFRYETKELRQKEPRETAPHHGDPIALYRVFAFADPEDAPAILGEVTDVIPNERLAELAELVVPHAQGIAATRPLTALRVVANLASKIANEFRSEPDTPGIRAAVEALRRTLPAFRAAVANARPIEDSESRFTHVEEHFETELRLIREREERDAERAREEEERRREREAREAERARQIAEAEAAAKAAHEAQRALAEEAERRRRAAIDAQKSGAPPPKGAFLPDIPASSLDVEPFLGDQPLPTLLAYTGFIKEMQAGADVMALMAAHGMDPMRWSACATAWGTFLQSRMDLAMRFAALLQATWRRQS